MYFLFQQNMSLTIPKTIEDSLKSKNSLSSKYTEKNTKI